MWNWYDGDTSIRDDEETLYWWYAVTDKDPEIQDQNFDVMFDCGSREQFDLWNSMGIEYDLESLINGTVTAAQFQEKCRSLSGLERLELLHGQLHPGSGSPFRFSWDMIPKTGLSTKDFIAPDSFDFRFSRLFRVGTTWGAASYLQILASELSDKLLAELLEMDAEMTITLHIQTVDQAAAVKSIKAKVSDIDKMKVEEQKKAARSGYDMDILPPDLVTYSNDAKTLLEDLQSRNERMFLLTFLVVNMAPTRRELDNDLFTV